MSQIKCVCGRGRETVGGERERCYIGLGKG